MYTLLLVKFLLLIGLTFNDKYLAGMVIFRNIEQLKIFRVKI